MSRQVRLVEFGITLGTLLMLTTLALAQNTPERGDAGGRRTFGGFGGIGLLRSEQVQKELKLNEEQKTKLQQLGDRLAQSRQQFWAQFSNLTAEQRQQKRDELREQMQQSTQKRLDEARKEIAGILTPDQLTRWRQIELQQEGPAALLRPEVADGIGLTNEQKSKLEQVSRDTQDKIYKLFQETRDADNRTRNERREQLREKAQKIHEEGETLAMALLQPEQKQKLRDMMGKPFPLQRVSPMPRRQGGWGLRSDRAAPQ